MLMHVHAPGLFTTVQDKGRFGWQAAGVSVAGPMDPAGHARANALAGNAPDAALLEVTLTGPSLSFDRPALVAIAGGQWRLRVGTRELQTPGAAEVAAGERVTLERIAGARAYLAVAGGIDVPLVLGSRATDVRGGFGGFRGRPLRGGDVVPVASVSITRVPVPASVPEPAAPDPARLRVLAGPGDGPWARRVFRELQQQTWTVSPQSNRVGFRLAGPPVTGGSGLAISVPTVTGAIQVPPDGKPILLMPDRQTTGGYPVGAVVITADLAAAGQLAPGDRVVFEGVALEDARAALRGAGRDC